MTSKKSPFDIEPGFFLEDNRNQRQVVPVTKDTLNVKHEALLPEWLIKGKRVLDLGSCIGATGHWCLSFGAAHYTGVELQPEYLRISEKLLSKHWSNNQFTLVKSEISNFLDQVTEEQFDVVVMAGVLYVFADYFSILKKMAFASKEWVLIESILPQRNRNPDAPVVEFVPHQTITLPNGQERARGLGSRISPGGLEMIMSLFGFGTKEGVIRPVAVEGSHDAFNEIIPGWKTPVRFMMRFKRGEEKTEDLASELKAGKFAQPKAGFDKYIPGEKIKAGSWKFDEKTAGNFEKIALTSIPRYKEVIGMCVEITGKAYPEKDCRVIDIGSAIGYTVDEFIKNGFSDVWGVENSESMIRQSRHSEKIFLSETFPKDQGPFDVVCANWVLHFVKRRKEYFQDIYDGLSSGGYLIISDKMEANPFILELYHDFKRRNGLTEKEISDKADAIKGVLEPYPLMWYLTELRNIGFREVNVINAYYHFVTLLVRK